MKNYAIIRTIYNFLENKEKKNIFIIFLNGLINLFFDLMSIGLIIPIIYSVVNQKEFYIPLLGDFKITLYASLSFFIIIILFKNLFYFYNSKLLLKFCKNLFQRVSIGLLTNQLKTSYLEYLKIGYSDFSRSILLEVNYLVSFYRGIINVVIHSFIFIGILTFLFFYNFIATASLISFYFIFLLLPSIFIYRKIDKLAKDRKFLDKNKIYISNHIFQNLSIIKLFKIENYFVDFFKNANKNQQDNLFQISKIQLLPKIFVELTTLTFLVLLIFLNIYMAIELEKIILVITIFLFAAVRLMPSINEIMSNLQQIKYFFNSFSSINIKIKDTNLNNQNILDNKNIKVSFKNEMSINNLCFHYPGESKEIIKNLSFKIEKNSLFGIHGESGSGKTTLINLILGLIEPTGGQLLSDNVDINKNNVSSWQDLISYVPSNYLLLNSSIKSNVAYGKYEKDINEKNVFEALENAQLYNFMKLSGINHNFIIEEDGKNLSAGQIQRMCISRALYRNTPILILDEPTSNLDKDNAYKIIKLIKSVKNLTTIIVSHDNNIINMCDQSIKLD